MKKEMFEELLGSVREAGAILRGQPTPLRQLVASPSIERHPAPAVKANSSPLTERILVRRS